MDSKDLKILAEKAQEFLKYETDKKITWCGNCGNYGIQNAITRALVLEGYTREDFVMCFDVGCNGNGSDKIEANTIHGLHGRVIPLGAGCSLANNKMKVIAAAGDGATFSEGVNHLVHAVRSNYNMIFIHHNNENYGLTTGQASALTRCGVRMNGTPDGVVIEPINSLDFVLTLNPSFVARGYSGDVGQMTDIFREALKHKGFAFVEVLQACPTYNRETPDEWYQSRVKDLEKKKKHDPSDIWAARKLVQDQDKDIYTGIIYRDENKKEFTELLENRKDKKTTLIEEVAHVDVSGLW